MKYTIKRIKHTALAGLMAISLISPWVNAAQIELANNESFVVEDIEVTGLQRMELGTFYNLLPLQVGESLEPSRVPTIIRALFGSNAFEDIRLFRDGNKLMIDLRERPTIADISIEGNSDIETEQIIQAMNQAGFAKGEVFDPSAIKNIKAGMEAQYFAHGKYSVKIEDTIVKMSRNRVLVKFVVNEGEPAEIKRISIVGNKLFEDDDLMDQFELSVGDGLFGFFSDTQYSKEKLSGDLETLRSYYLDRGYLKYANTSTQVSISPDRKGIYITINIDEGEKFKIQSIIFSGDLILPKEQLDQLMPLVKGDTYSAAAVSFAEEQIKSHLGFFGYAFANVVTVPKINEDEKTVELTLFIEPGKKVYINRIDFSGNEATNDEVLRREIRLMEGSAMSTQAIERSKLRLQRLAHLEEVEVETPKTEGSDNQVDVNFKIKERAAGSISGGLGYNDTFGLSVNANVSHNNFLGGGTTVQFAINKSDFTENYSLSYSDPYFTLDGISARVSTYLRKSDYSSIGLAPTTLDQKGIDVSFGYPFNEVSRLHYGIGYQDSLLKATGSLSEQVIEFFEQNDRDINQDPRFDYDLFKLNLGVTRNTLNRGVFPDRGTSQSINLTSTVPGSDLEYYKLEYNIDHYIPLAPRWSFLSSLNIAWGEGYGDDENLPYFENFSAGGSGTMRGFESNTIGPHLIYRIPRTQGAIISPDLGAPTAGVTLPREFDVISIDERRAVGGNARVLATLELIFPIPFAEPSNSVRTSFFVDVGNVWNTHFDRADRYGDLAQAEQDLIPDFADSSSYRMSTGLSLQWLSPMGPLTISFSRPLRKEDSDQTESFSFDIGRTF